MNSVLCIAGHDPSGGAGIAADIRACNHMNVECRPVITALTAQSHDEFGNVWAVPLKVIEEQLDMVLADGNVGAVKVGLVHSPSIPPLLARKLGELDAPVVLDPVLATSSGGSVALPGLIDALEKNLFQIVEVLTPNRMEAEALTGRKLENPKSAREGCRIIHGRGVKNVLLKGGHFPGEMAADLFFDGAGFHEIISKRVRREFRGTGCAYSTLIAGHMAGGDPVLDAIGSSKNLLYEAMEYTNSLDAPERILVFGARR